MNSEKQSKLWINNNWVYFKIKIGTYTNIITFLDDNNISFIKYNYIDFTKIPSVIYGYGKSTNLLEYLSNNNNNGNLIISFLNYFLNSLKFSYIDGSAIRILMVNNIDWKISNVIVIKNNWKYFTVDTSFFTADNSIITADKTIITI